MSRMRAADDFEAIRLRMEELRHERGERRGASRWLKSRSRSPTPLRMCRATSFDAISRKHAARHRADLRQHCSKLFLVA